MSTTTKLDFRWKICFTLWKLFCRVCIKTLEDIPHITFLKISRIKKNARIGTVPSSVHGIFCSSFQKDSGWYWSSHRCVALGVWLPKCKFHFRPSRTFHTHTWNLGSHRNPLLLLSNKSATYRKPPVIVFGKCLLTEDSYRQVYILILLVVSSVVFCSARFMGN